MASKQAASDMPRIDMNVALVWKICGLLQAL